MQTLPQKITAAVDYLKQQGADNIDGCIVLGTGLGKFTSQLDIERSIPYTDIPYFSASTVESHAGNLLVGYIGTKKIVAMQGRFHYYEGYDMQEITFPVRVLKMLGAKFLLLSNAAGGMNPKFKKGDLVYLDDHINKLPDNPLRGLHDPFFGNRFVDMSAPYDNALNKMIKKCAKKKKIKLHKGVYVAVEGPSLETRAEYRYLRAAGADMVGMSTVPEVIVANHVQLPCACISVITDECDPDNLQPVNIAEIIAVAARADEKLSTLLVNVILDM